MLRGKSSGGFGNDRTVKLAQAFIRIPSITAVKPEDEAASRGIISFICKAARKSGARAKVLKFSGGHSRWGYPVENLYLEWNYGSGGEPQRHICYIGHLDVVPPGNQAQWTYPPFDGVIQDIYLY